MKGLRGGIKEVHKHEIARACKKQTTRSFNRNRSITVTFLQLDKLRNLLKTTILINIYLKIHRQTQP